MTMLSHKLKKKRNRVVTSLNSKLQINQKKKELSGFELSALHSFQCKKNHMIQVFTGGHLGKSTCLKLNSSVTLQTLM